MDKYIGKRLDGRYEIIEVIGVGGMAVVYKARDVLDDRIVAVKVLKSEFLGNEEFRRRFKNECKAIAVLSHPNIIKVYDVNFGGNIEYIVMEYVDGITLKEYIEQQSVVKWKEAVHFTTQILKALQHAHDKGIVHRDIKPQNIMLLQDGTIKVMDFGIARFSRNTSHTVNTDRAIGSVHYISPEQASGDVTDERSDIYSVGVMLYEMLTGKLPFEADTAVSVAIMQLQSTPRMPREINETIPEGLEEITMHAMQKDPQKRYQSAAEMLRDIEEFKRNPSIRFEYKYFVDDNPTRIVQSIDRVRATDSYTALDEPEEDGEEDDKKKKKHSAIPLLAGIAFGVVLFTVAFVIAVMWWMGVFTGQDGDLIEVPKVIGMTMEEAKLQYPDFAFEIKNTLYNTAPKDQIIEQDPSEGSKVEKGAAVKVVVSLGPKENVVPDIVGKDWKTAKATLDGAKIQYEVQEREDEETAEGYVIQTSPAVGETVKEGQTILVYVSLGPSQIPVTVPNVIGISEANAKRLLEEKGFTVGESVQVDSDRPINEVLSCDPKVDSTVTKGTKVTLTISNGKAPTKQATVTVNLPKTSTPVYLKVYVDGVENRDLRTKEIIPSQRPQYDFTLEGTGTSTITVRISTNPDSGFADYAIYTVNYDSHTVKLTQQNEFKDPNANSSKPESSSKPHDD